MIKKYFRKLNQDAIDQKEAIEKKAREDTPRDIALKVGEDDSYDIMFTKKFKDTKEMQETVRNELKERYFKFKSLVVSLEMEVKSINDLVNQT